MSSLRLFGRYWKLGSEDLLVPCLFNGVVVDIPLLCIFIFARAVFGEVKYPTSCSPFFFGAWLTTGVVLWTVVFVCDVCMIIAALRTHFLQPNFFMHILVYIRSSLSLAMLIYVIILTIGGSISLACFGPSWDEFDEQTAVFMKLLFAAYICMWLVVSAVFCFACCTFQSKNPIKQQEWDRRLRHFCCLRFLMPTDSEEDTLSSIAEFFSDLFKIRGIGHRLVPSDIGVGLLLVRSLQARQAKNSLPPPQHEKAMQGMQPDLSHEDWQKVRDAKNFAPFAVGSYGYKLRAIMQPSCCCRGVVCGMGLGVCCGYPLDTSRLLLFKASGCRCFGLLPPHPWCGCSHWNLNAFMHSAGIPPSSLVSCNLDVGVHRPVYYVAFCPKRQAIVVAIRGTMSVSDCITDANCKNVHFTGAGLAVFDTPSNYYVHSGMLSSAFAMKKDLYEGGLFDLLNLHMNAQLVIVGHSLGAGVATVLTTVLLHDAQFSPHRHRLRCFAYAPPLIMSPALCSLPCVSSAITSIVWDNDIVSRLSRANIFKLRAQLEQCFECVSPTSNKFRILYNAVKKDHSKNWEVIESSMEWDKLSPREPSYGLVESPLSQSLSEEKNEEERPEVCWMAGKLYHMLPRKGVKDIRSPGGIVVYPAEQETFQEITVGSSMFVDHMPYLYTMQNLDVPETVEIETR